MFPKIVQDGQFCQSHSSYFAVHNVGKSRTILHGDDFRTTPDIFVTKITSVFGDRLILKIGLSVLPRTPECERSTIFLLDDFWSFATTMFSDFFHPGRWEVFE